MRKIGIFILIIFLSGCATASYRVAPVFEKYFDTPKTITMVPPDIKIHRLTAGGIPELVDEWSDDAKKKIVRLLKDELDIFRSVKVSLTDEGNLGEKDRDFLKEEKGLFYAVAYSIIMHTYSPENTFKHKLAHFDYTMGSEISALSDITGGDVLLFCSGTNYIWTAGRVALSVFAAVVSGSMLMPGPEWFIAALVDAKTGNIIWFNYISMPGDLRNEEVDKKVIKAVFSSFPAKYK